MPDAVVAPPHVVLVGLMGSGKTTVGKKVAKLAGRRFVDADVELEARTGRSVAEWFAAGGEEGFRSAEADLLDALLATEQPLVVGAGGGVVVRPANRERLRADDVTVVYLHGEPAFLASRVQQKAHRPLLEGQDPRALFDTMYADRDAWYRDVSDVVIEVRPHHEAGEKPKWRMAESIVEALVARGEVEPAALDRLELR